MKNETALAFRVAAKLCEHEQGKDWAEFFLTLLDGPGFGPKWEGPEQVMKWMTTGRAVEVEVRKRALAPIALSELRGGLPPHDR